MFLPMSWTSPFTVAIKNLPAQLESSSPSASGSLPSAIAFCLFSSSIKGNKYATAFFMTRADLMTCGRNILPDPKSSPTTFMPFINGPSMTLRGLGTVFRHSSVSPSIYSEIPLTRACVRRSLQGRARQELASVCCTLPPLLRASMSAFSEMVRSDIFSVASGVKLKTKLLTVSTISFGISSTAMSSLAFTIPMSMPELMMASCRKAAWIDSRTMLTPRNPKDKLETPPDILT
mmetsp:Transcript_151309/g.278964  ORF Transcript_151309/g.278964 Transcript_151309/m.278964 type:complete len:233 (-) Transcript_151309:2460-3158(-)